MVQGIMSSCVGVKSGIVKTGLEQINIYCYVLCKGGRVVGAYRVV